MPMMMFWKKKRPTKQVTHKSLFELRSVQAVIAVGLFGTLAISLLIISFSDLTWDFSYEGWNNAVTIFRVPLGLLASTFTIIALLASNHRSEQSKGQIAAAESQNNFANYYKHLEEFEKHAENIFKHREDLNPVKLRALHNIAWPNARQGDFQFNIQEIWGLRSVDINYLVEAWSKKGLRSKEKKTLFEMTEIVLKSLNTRLPLSLDLGYLYKYPSSAELRPTLDDYLKSVKFHATSLNQLLNFEIECPNAQAFRSDLVKIVLMPIKRAESDMPLIDWMNQDDLPEIPYGNARNNNAD